MTTPWIPKDESIQNPLADNDGIQLPFAAPLFSWRNGNVDLKELADTRYFGGWELSSDNWDTVKDDCGELPVHFKLCNMHGKQSGKDYQSYMTRVLPVALIAKRKRWIEPQPGDTGKGKSHVQILAYMAEIKESAILPWGPVVLSAKSYSGNEIEKALKEFDSKTLEARKTFTGGTPFWYFYAGIGTFGKEIKSESRGSSKKNSITPCQISLPDEITEAWLTKWFVGKDVAAEMAAYLAQAREWLDDPAWKKADLAPVAPSSQEPSEEDVNSRLAAAEEDPFAN